MLRSTTDGLVKHTLQNQFIRQSQQGQLVAPPAMAPVMTDGGGGRGRRRRVNQRGSHRRRRGLRAIHQHREASRVFNLDITEGEQKARSSSLTRRIQLSFALLLSGLP